MKFSIIPLFVLLAAATTSVMAQADAGYTDDIFGRGLESGELIDARSEVDAQIQFALRELEEVRRRSADHSHFVSRSMEHLERRTRAACFAACIAGYSAGPNRDNCFKKCRAMWGGHGA